MKIYIPAKALRAFVQSSTSLEFWPYDDGEGDQFWQGGSTPKPYRWRLTGSVNQQEHGSHLTRQPKRYNGLDIYVGDYIANAKSGVTLKVISVVSKSEGNFEIDVEDVFRYNTFRSSVGTGIFTVPASAIIFEVNENGEPMIDSLPAGYISSSFYISMNARFNYFTLQENYPIEQSNHNLQIGDPVAINPNTQQYEIADKDSFDRFVGTVSASGPGPNMFLLRPKTKIIEDYEPALPGSIGDFVYVDLDTPGQITNERQGRELFLKLTESTSTVITGTEPSPTITPGDQIEINDFVTTITGSSIDDVVDDINAHTSIHQVTADVKIPANTAITDLNELVYGVVAAYTDSPGPASAEINGTLVTFSDNTDGQAQYGQNVAILSDMVRTINNANITNVTASESNDELILTEETGGAINITNINNDTNDNPWGGNNSCAGVPLSTSAVTDEFLRLTRDDGGGIIVVNITGTPVDDLGIFSAQNGRLPVGLVIEQGIRKGDMFVVSDITERDNLVALLGDEAFVLDKGDGEWGKYLYDGSNWIVTSTEESSTVDSRTLSEYIDSNTNTAIMMGEVNPGVRVSFVTVEVTSAFDGNPSIAIGDTLVADRLFTDANIDFTTPGSYAATPSYQFPGPNDEFIIADFDPGGSTVGAAKITITYS